MPLADWEIEDLQLIEPCVKRAYCGSLSYGLEPSGYDIRLGDRIAILGTDPAQLVDPTQNIMPEHLPSADIADGGYLLKPGEFVLASSFEKFRLRNDTDAVVKDKSTLIRLGLAVQNTKLACGWRGILTLELTNHGPYTFVLRKGMPIAQVEFRRINKPESVYKGRYQDQTGVQPAKIVRRPEC